MSLFITAIHTDSGKTLISSIVCLALKMDYWKPVQAGVPTDSDAVSAITGGRVRIHPERFRLKTPESPHAAAKKENISIQLNDFALPQSMNGIVVEGAGGCLVPLNDTSFVIDIAAHLKLPVVVVSNLYLGSINHTLMTIEVLKQRGHRIKGIIFNGKSNPESENIILHHAKVQCLLKVPPLDRIDIDSIQPYVHEFNNTWRQIAD